MSSGKVSLGWTVQSDDDSIINTITGATSSGMLIHLSFKLINLDEMMPNK